MTLPATLLHLDRIEFLLVEMQLVEYLQILLIPLSLQAWLLMPSELDPLHQHVYEHAEYLEQFAILALFLIVILHPHELTILYAGTSAGSLQTECRFD